MAIEFRSLGLLLIRGSQSEPSNRDERSIVTPSERNRPSNWTTVVTIEKRAGKELFVDSPYGNSRKGKWPAQRVDEVARRYWAGVTSFLARPVCQRLEVDHHLALLL